MSYYSELTERQLITGYREAVTHRNELISCFNKGWTLYLGEGIRLQIMQANSNVHGHKQELERRGRDMAKFKNIPELITKLSSKQRDEASKQREIERLAAKNEENLKQQAVELSKSNELAFSFMAKFAHFQLNYPHNFISIAFADGMTEHLQSKFSHIYNEVGAKCAIIAFWMQLDNENRRLLTDYINNLDLN